MEAVTIEQLTIADEPERWAALGLTVAEESIDLGGVSVKLAGSGAGHGITGWSLHGIQSAELDGLPTRIAESAPRTGGAARFTTHELSPLAIDHIVAMTPALDRTVAALQDAGLDLRRIREQPTPAGAPRQAFFRLGAVILEVVQEPEEMVARRGEHDGRARLWGMALVARDLDGAVARLGDRIGEIRPAVQPGRRIATVRRSAGLAVPVALMSD